MVELFDYLFYIPCVHILAVFMRLNLVHVCLRASSQHGDGLVRAYTYRPKHDGAGANDKAVLVLCANQNASTDTGRGLVLVH